ncbi:hypothetical protein BCR33DRAFT_720924 [Rhizoclosmatium globosum]|uniref:Uncharacterized protein n=1 Tax=Rhizoclosmatium globosum TaxID=329046 RepID=A0A1Y2BTX5_9FUNG|nr:hypothetical protein BCR33DRAFT_720924 [Rhizoclosmatium globosum]|eukprot:ORY38220.1 hypothetical protein BCR33DRAFT_720924 [Rhizoclosmatium globosum]
MDPRVSGSNYSHETFFGYIKNPSDALVIIECCIQRHLKPFDRPPSDMLHLPIRSGSVIVLSDSANGVKRWRPVRAYGPFLLYKYTKWVTKRTLTLFGSDGNRHRVISYYNQQDVLDLHNRLARNERPWDETVFKLPSKTLTSRCDTAPFAEYSHMSLPPILDKRQITRITDKPSLPKLREVLPSQFLDNQWCHTSSNYHQVPGYPMWHPYYYHHIPASAESYQHRLSGILMDTFPSLLTHINLFY